MKKILLLLLVARFSSQAQTLQNPTYGNVKLKNNTTDNSATKVNVQSTDGTINTISKSDLVNVVEVNDVPSLPLVGEVGKIYVVKNVNKIYRWNGTYYTELAITDISGKVDKIVGKELSTEDYTTPEKTKLAELFNYDPTTINNAIALKVDKVTGKSLLSDTEITRLATLSNYTHPTNHPPSIITQDASNRFVTDAEKTDWNAKQSNIGYVPANDNAVVHLAGAETITGQKTFSPTISASGAIARGTYLTPSLTATANNDVLVGLDINTTFTNGAFTGTKSLPVRVTSNQYIGMNVSRNSTEGSAITISNNNGGYNFGVGSINEFFIQRAGGNIVNTIFSTGNSIIQNGGTFTDDLTNRLQVTGTVSSGTTALNNTPPTANNQLTRKDYVDTGLVLKAPLASPSLTGTPTAPTATAGTNTTQIATTAFVTNGIATADSQNVKLTGDQTISGQKSFSLTGKIDMKTNNVFPAISVTALGSNGGSAAEFINNSSFPYSNALRLYTSSSGGVGNRTLDVLNTSPIGTGIVSEASNGGVSISSQSGNGDSYVSNITSGGTGRNYVGRNDGTETYSVDKIGNVIGNSYIKRSTPANNILLAGGGDLAQNTAFNKNFGTTAGTVVEGNYPPAKDGTGATGTWGIDISGSSKGLGTYGYVDNDVSTDFDFAFVRNNSQDIKLISKADFKSALGLGSNAYSSTAYLPLSGGTLTGIVTAPTAPAGTNTTQIATTAFVQANSRPYKVYTALLSQSGTNAPTAVVLENTLGGTVVWTRTSTGSYLGTLTGVFTANKTFCTTTIGMYLSGGSNSIGLVRNSVDDVFLFTNRGIAGTDAILNNASIEIRVYPSLE